MDGRPGKANNRCKNTERNRNIVPENTTTLLLKVFVLRPASPPLSNPSGNSNLVPYSHFSFS